MNRIGLVCAIGAVVVLLGSGTGGHADTRDDKARIDRQLQEDIARPIISNQMAAGCWQPWVKNYTIQTNSIYNGWRFEDVWLDR